jgi:hypothetical protein
MDTRGIIIKPIGIEYERLHYSITYTGGHYELSLTPPTHFDWTQVLAAQHSWIFNGVATV